MKRYDGAVAVVSGASSGIGRRMALDLAGRGAAVVGLARRRELLADLERELQRTSPKSRTQPCDVSQTDTFTAALADVEREHGRIDVLINNAAIEQPTPVEVTDGQLDTYRHLFDTNFFGLVAGTLAALPGMLERRSGIIVNVSSDTARAPEPRESAYAASKAAVAAFSESVAHEVADWEPSAMGMSGIGPDDPLPPTRVRRTEQQVSELVMERMGGGRMEINAAWLPLLGPIGRSLAPRAYQRGMRRFANR